MNEEAYKITLLVIRVLDELGVPYLIGGSLASAFHGTPRSTIDADLLADIRLEHKAALFDKLQSAFYVTQEEIQSAIDHRSSFNLIHLQTSFKVDIFLPKHRQFDKEQFKNRRLFVLDEQNPDTAAYVASAEDTILAKLEWYRSGNEISDRQWRDIQGVWNLQREQLNSDYLVKTAEELGVSDLLQRLMTE